MNTLSPKAAPESLIPRQSAAPAASVSSPFVPRLGRALAILLTAVLAHVWLLPATRGQRPQLGSLAPGVPALSHAKTPAAVFAPTMHEAAPDVRIEHEITRVRTHSGAGTPDGFDVIPIGTSGTTTARPEIDAAPLPQPVASVTIEPGLGALPLATYAVRPPELDVTTTSRAERIETAVLTPLSGSRERAAQALAIRTPRVQATATSDTSMVQGQEAIVRKIIEDYTRAYERFDVQAAKALWPSLDVRALRKAFDDLEGQRVRFSGCDVSVASSNANARCRVDATYRPRVGSRVMHLQREWSFNLARGAHGWQIVDARMQKME
jgi:hypothetical protein